MSHIDIQKRTIGVTFTTTGAAEIRVWAPLLQKLAITFNNTTLPLLQDEYGYWKNTTDQLPPGGLYQYILNEEKQLPDPASLSQPQGVHGPSQAVDADSYIWADDNWNNIPLEQYIFYELHTGTFTPQGTFEGVEEKLDYLKNLGITAIEIMPVSQFPGNRNWGYDGVFPYAVQNSYGGAKALQHLVDICHQKGIAVVLDVVYNHLGPEGNYLSEYAPFFTDKYHTPWGNALNFDDAYCDGVRQYFIENALMWFRDFHIDGLRLDAVHAIKDFSPVPILKELKQYVDALIAATGRTHYLIVESDLNDNRFINPITECGYGMDAQWLDEFHHALRVTAGEPRSGYYADFDGIHLLAKAYKDAYVYDGQYSPHRKKTFGVRTNNPGKQFVVFSQNHDQVGNRMLGERTSQLTSFDMQKLLAASVIFSPYLPMLFMGEEWSEPHPFLYFVSHTDPDLAEAVRNGRKAEFAAFHIAGEAPDPMAEETFQQSKLQWELLDKKPHNIMLHYYQTLINIRQQQPAFYHLDRKNMDVEYNSETQTLLLHRWHNEQHIICLMNFSKRAQTFTLPTYASIWKQLLNSAAPQWNSPYTAPDIVNKTTSISVPPEAILVYANDIVS